MPLGETDGDADGRSDGEILGCVLGDTDGDVLRDIDGDAEGIALGVMLGEIDGDADGKVLGTALAEGAALGTALGAQVSAAVPAARPVHWLAVLQHLSTSPGPARFWQALGALHDSLKRPRATAPPAAALHPFSALQEFCGRQHLKLARGLVEAFHKQQSTPFMTSYLDISYRAAERLRQVQAGLFSPTGFSDVADGASNAQKLARLFSPTGFSDVADGASIAQKLARPRPMARPCDTLDIPLVERDKIARILAEAAAINRSSWGCPGACA